MLKPIASMGKAEVQATVESKIKNVVSSLNRDLDLNLPRSFEIWTFHASRFTFRELRGIS
jgi:hypothetical protein